MTALPPDLIEHLCKNCKFYVGLDPKEGETCRRYPPKHDNWLGFHDSEILRDIAWSLRDLTKNPPNTNDDYDLFLESTEVNGQRCVSRWPTVDEEDWCGEFQPK